MAEIASGAVSSLLGLLRTEALLLSGVGSDLEFIKEEMESMHSFLEHLSRTAPPAGGHDEQVRTWMNQVRDLARDCSNFIDLHHRSGDIAVYRATGRRYLWWADWLLHKLLSQHQAAKRLRELKERARDVGKRRLRYDVRIPKKEAAAEFSPAAAAPYLPSSSQAAAAAAAAAGISAGQDDGDDDVDDGNVQDQGTPAVVGSRLLERRLLLLEDLCAEKLAARWLYLQDNTTNMTSTGIVTPDEDAGAVAQHSLDLAARGFHKVWIRLPAVHYGWDRPLLPWEILCYILHKCKKSSDEERWVSYSHKQQVIAEVSEIIENMGVGAKIEGIRSRIVNARRMKTRAEAADSFKVEDTRSLFIAQVMDDDPDVELNFGEVSEKYVAETLKDYMEHVETGRKNICLRCTQYEDILRKVFVTKASNPPQPEAVAQQEATTRLGGDDRIKEMIEYQKITLQIIWELLHNKPQLLAGGNSANGAAQPQGRGDQVTNNAQPQADSAAALAFMEDAMKRISTTSAVEAAINEDNEKMDKISEQIKTQMLIQGIVDKINEYLKDKKTLIILQDDEDYVSGWEETMYALNLLACRNDSAVVVTTKNTKKAKEFCNPLGEPIICSIVGLYYDIVHQLTHKREYDPQVLHDILDRCHPDEFCMKIFARAFYANPKRSRDELTKLYEDLAAQKTLGSDGKRMRMIKFSYRDMPREYKSCLLYLAIFPQGHKIRRSTLIGRWVTEGLITKQDWRSAVRHGDQCFDALIKRGLILPQDVAAAGKVRSCTVDDQVHGFITKIANKQHILDARLSGLLARHFSIFSGLRLRSSDTIDKFVHKLPKYSPQLPLLKVLDLEGTDCFQKNHYLKDICSKILLLKYLSLRRTNVSRLPNEINNLHELEVLDIRETKVPKHGTRHVMLPKLRRFMADSVADPINKSSRSAVQIPSKIEKMENLEVLSNVRALRTGSELKDIGLLWQLRKLGVVIQDNNEHLYYFLSVVNDLKDCLESLLVTISDNRSKSISSKKDEKLKDMCKPSRQTTRQLIRLTIDGVTKRVNLLDLLAKGSKELSEVTLRGTLLKQEDLSDVLGVVPKLRYLILRYGAYNDIKLTFKKEEFSHLKYFLVEGTSKTDRKESMNMTGIEFEHGATVELEKIVLSFTNISSLGGIEDLPSLKDLELEGNEFLHSFLREGEAQEQSNESIALENTQNTASRQNMGSRFTFKKDKFKHLEYFRLEDSKVTNITFEDGTTPELNKIALSLSNKGSQVAGVSHLQKLREIEVRGDKVLSLFTDAIRIAKVTLCGTQLNQEDLQILAKKTNLRCLVLLDKAYDNSHLAFDQDDFPKLDLLIVECLSISSISFSSGSAPMLKKIVWSFTEMKSFSGINNLLKLTEIECIGDVVPHQVRKDIAAHEGKPIFTHKQKQDYEKEEKTQQGMTLLQGFHQSPAA